MKSNILYYTIVIVDADVQRNLGHGEQGSECESDVQRNFTWQISYSGYTTGLSLSKIRGQMCSETL